MIVYHRAKDVEADEVPQKGKRVATQAVKRAPPAAREEEEAPKKSGGFFGFGAAKAAEVEEDSDEEEDEPKSGGFFGFGARWVACKMFR